ncbi:MAG TPA: asparagine synthase (glutamine-hydrolyzing) [Candidatus Polarisedimenticolia bacterium]|jgi:asparagine synthase (glutamine-hydrolysing)|nr:asparagine synthase (glutamine-hydrolyzing) [Candidatus Polarisedimenticolia bacterium]
MCGVAGAFSLDGSPVRHLAVKAMTQALLHRGPDEGAVVLLGPERGAVTGGPDAHERRPAGSVAAIVGLGHRRLRVIDLSGAAAQPMRAAGGTGWLVYNGELYNTSELRRDLMARGVRFRSRSDTEVVLEALSAWGPEALSRFNGMFALAYWRPGERRLILARDRFGEKPLYYARAGGLLIFASEIGALVRHGGLALTVDPEAIELYLTFGFIPAPWTIYREIRKLPHASYLEARPHAEPRLARYYRLEERLRLPAPPKVDEAVRDTLRAAVACRLEADVPLGAFLSGGLDSSAVVALMAQLRKAPPRTYSMAVPGLEYFDESPRARRTASLLGTVHREVPVDAARLQAEIPFVLDRLDEPFADSSALASSIIAREARGDLTVALSGDGGDEVFGGYRLYRALSAHRLLHALPAQAVSALAALLAPFPARHGGGAAGAARRARRLLSGLSSDLAAAHALWMSATDAPARRALRPGTVDHDLGRALVEERYRRFGGGLDATLAVEIDLPLVDDMLAKVDRTSMRHALEVRAPFLDPALVELALSLPSREHFSPFSGKRLLRRALRGIVPGHVRRAPKRGFEVPVGHWLAGPLAGLYREVVTPQALDILAGADHRVAAGWLEDHRLRLHDRGAVLWALFALCYWHRGPHRIHLKDAAEAGGQLRDDSRRDAIVLRRSEG